MNAQETTLLLALPLLVAIAPLQEGQDPGAPAAPAEARPAQTPPAEIPPQDDGTSIFGEPLYVDGERITDEEIQATLCYGKGRNALEARKLGVLMQQERELRQFNLREEVAAEKFGSTAYAELTAEQRAEVDAQVADALSYLVVTEEQLQERLKEHADQFHERFPTLDIDTETRRAYESVQWYEDQVLQTMQFDEMFFHGHPDGWPDISKEAIQAGAPNVDLLADYAQHYQWRKEEAEQTGEPMKREEEMMMGLLRDFVIEALVSLVEIESQTDGLPTDVLMRVTGGGFESVLKTEDVYEEMKHVFAEEDIQNTKQLLALHEAAYNELSELGFLKPRDEYLESIADLRTQMHSSVFNWNFVATQGHQFPSEEAYNENVYLLESYKDMIREDIERDENNALPEALLSHVPKANVIMGLGRCQAEVLLVAAFDFPSYSWKEDGWAWAEQKAYRVRQEIDEHIDKLVKAEEERRQAVVNGENYEPEEELLPFDEYWSTMIDLHSEFWDPPMPLTGHMPPAVGLKNRGRFQGEPMTRNDFRRAIGESSFSFFLTNDSITDRVFFELEPGEVGGPWKGPYGYSIVYLRRRLAPSNPIDPVNNERHYGMLVEDYVRERFTEFAHEALAEAEVKGL